MEFVKELKFDDKVINNKYYKYDAYLESELLRLDDNINKVSEVSDLKKSNLGIDFSVCMGIMTYRV